MAATEKSSLDEFVLEIAYRFAIILAFVAIISLSACGLPQKAEEQVETQIAVSDGMVRTIEDGVQTEAGWRPVTQDELVRYVYALRFGYYALRYDAGLTDERPTLEEFAPTIGWGAAVAPEPAATPEPR